MNVESTSVIQPEYDAACPGGIHTCLRLMKVEYPGWIVIPLSSGKGITD